MYGSSGGPPLVLAEFRRLESGLLNSSPRARYMPGPVWAVILAVLYTSGMAVVWLVTKEDYATETAALVRSSIPVLLVLVAMVLAAIYFSKTSVVGDMKLRGWAWIGIVPQLIAPVGLILAIALGGIGSANWGLAAGVLFGTILVGIGEEGTFRGIALNGLGERFSVVWAVIISSVLFALLHAVNILAGQSLQNTVMQVVFTGFAGLTYAWIYVFSGRNIFLVMGLHFVYDFSLIAAMPLVGATNELGGIASITTTLAALILTGIGIWKFKGKMLADL